jgi:hypothetical protein
VAQGLFRNPLADPYLLGSASGAALGVALALLALGGAAGMLGSGRTWSPSAVGFAHFVHAVYYFQAFDLSGAPLDPSGTYELATNNYIAHGGSGVEVLQRGVGPAALEALWGDPTFLAQGGDGHAVPADGVASACVGLAAAGEDHRGRGFVPDREQALELGREPRGIRPLHRDLQHLRTQGADPRGVIESEPLPHPPIEPEHRRTTQEHTQRPSDVRREAGGKRKTESVDDAADDQQS